MTVQPFQSPIVAGTEQPEARASKHLRFHETREAWLNEAVKLFGPLFIEAGAPLPSKIRVSIGFCSTGRKSSGVGECWGDEASEDRHFEIFLKPEIEGAIMALDILAHELVHAAVGIKAGHGAAFKRVALGIGLAGKMRSTVAGPELNRKLHAIHAVLGEFPYGRLAGDNGRRKTATRLVKCACQECGYTLRTTRKWLDEAGAPICPSCMEPMKIQGEGESEGE